jgi:hypothetical protein
MNTVTFRYDQLVFSPRRLAGRPGQTRELSQADAQRLADMGYGRIVAGREPANTIPPTEETSHE